MDDNLDPTEFSTHEIVFTVQNGTGSILLNRPKALNAVSYDMVIALTHQLNRWKNDKNIQQIVIHSGSEKAFSAGGDIRQLYEMKMNDDPRMRHFYFHEYRLNQMIHHYPKPYIALINGIVMGGGVGVSFHGSHRILGENTRFAMPETTIGLFPDVGGTSLLAKIENKLGLILGLTGLNINAADCLSTGLGTHYVCQADWDIMKNALLSGQKIEDVTREYCTHPDLHHKINADHSSLANQIYEKGLVSLIADLDHKCNSEQLSDIENWFINEISKKSPIAVGITEIAFNKSQNLSFDQIMQMEYRMVQRILNGTDFFEGIRGLIIDKDNNVNWTPSKLDLLTPDILNAHFLPFSHKENESGLYELKFIE